MKFNLRKQALAAAFIMAFALGGCSGNEDKPADKVTEESEVSVETTETVEETTEQTAEDAEKKANDINTDIDLAGLQDSAAAIRDLDLGVKSSGENKDNDAAQKSGPEKEAKGDKTIYSYTDVTRSGNDLTVVPNGGLNGPTVLYGGKDLNGFLDYVDSTVLESGRNINRDFFYDVLAIMLVDKDLSSDINSIEKNMIMALAMGNNFYDTDVKINECYLDANNAADYHYKLTAYGKDDTWIVNYGKRTVYMNNGSTEYNSDMFRDDHLAVWMTAIEEYYGIK